MVIYKTTNLINGKIYIGQDLENNPNYFGSGLIFKKAILKYGKNNFKKEILEYCFNKQELCEKEKYWIKKLNSQNKNIGYNITGGGEFGDTLTHNPNREEISKKRNEIIRSEYVRNKISNTLKKYYSNEENRLKTSIATKNGMLNDIVKNKISLGKKGKRLPDWVYKQQAETRKLKGVVISEDVKRRISIANSGSNNGMYGKSTYSVWIEKYGIDEADRRKKEWVEKMSKSGKDSHFSKYIIQTPNNIIIEIISRKEVMKQLKCSGTFFRTKKFKKYILLDSIKTNNNK